MTEYIDPIARANEICKQAPAFEFADDDVRDEALEFNQWLLRELQKHGADYEAFMERMSEDNSNDGKITSIEREELFGHHTRGRKLIDAMNVMLGWTLSAQDDPIDTDH